MPPGIGYGSDAVMRSRPQPPQRRFDMSMGIPPSSAIDGAIQGMQGQLGFGVGGGPAMQGAFQGAQGAVAMPMDARFDPATGVGGGRRINPATGQADFSWMDSAPPQLGGGPHMDMGPGRAAPPGWRPGQGNIPPEFLGLPPAPPSLSVGPLPGSAPPMSVGPMSSMGNPNIPPQLQAIFERLSGPKGADAKFQPVTGGGLKAGPVGSMQGGTANWTPEQMSNAKPMEVPSPPSSRPKVKARPKDRPNSGDKSGVGILKRQDAVKKRQKRLMKVTA